MKASKYLLFLLFSIAATKVFAERDIIDSWTKKECDYTNMIGYDVKELEDIFQGTPNKPAQFSQGQSNQFFPFVTNIVAGGFGLVPKVGALLSGFFNGLVSLFSPVDNSLERAITSMYEYIETEVSNLRKYVDERIADLSAEMVEQNLQSSFSVAKTCRGNWSENMEGLLGCIRGARQVILGKLYDMAPVLDEPSRKNAFSENDLRLEAATLERSLPMFRQYGDLLIMTTLVQIGCDTYLGYDTSAENAIEDLQEHIRHLIKHYDRAVAIIELGNIAAYDFDLDTCVSGDDWVKYKIESTFGTSGGTCTFEGFYRRRNFVHRKVEDPVAYVWWGMDAYKNLWENFKAAKLPKVRAYYNVEFGATIDNWIKILDEFGCKDSLTRYVKVLINRIHAYLATDMP